MKNNRMFLTKMIWLHLDRSLHWDCQSIFLNLDHNVQRLELVFYRCVKHRRVALYFCVSTPSTNRFPGVPMKGRPVIVCWLFNNPRTNHCKRNKEYTYFVVVVQAYPLKSNNFMSLSIFSLEYNAVSTWRNSSTIRLGQTWIFSISLSFWHLLLNTQ